MRWTKGEFSKGSKDLSKLSVCYLNIQVVEEVENNKDFVASSRNYSFKFYNFLLRNTNHASLEQT